jgi:hypothetical protein
MFPRKCCVHNNNKQGKSNKKEFDADFETTKKAKKLTKNLRLKEFVRRKKIWKTHKFLSLFSFHSFLAQASQEPRKSEPEFVNLLKIPRINSQPGGIDSWAQIEILEKYLHVHGLQFKIFM